MHVLVGDARRRALYILLLQRQLQSMGARVRKTPALLAVLEALLHVDRSYGLEIIERTG